MSKLGLRLLRQSENVQCVFGEAFVWMIIEMVRLDGLDRLSRFSADAPFTSGALPKSFCHKLRTVMRVTVQQGLGKFQQGLKFM